MVRELIQEYRLYGNFKTFIEKSNWDEILLSSEGILDNCCLGIVVFSISYFGTGFIVGLLSK